ncbi:hypothetical protein [Paenibacillus turpanensis]|uniref:hypothetical protein n=1 Tax=Paenibacillus turpanensis TaxID=2689078 RepID=UPI00140DA7BC|nr:hypothetical protein [Paenibacillus turpanensis]
MNPSVSPSANVKMVQQPPQLGALLSGWLSTGLLFVAGQSVYSYGALAGFLIAGAFFTGFLLAIPFFLYKPKQTKSPSLLMRLAAQIAVLESMCIPLIVLILLTNTSIAVTPAPIVFLTVFAAGVLGLGLVWRKQRERVILLHALLILGAAIILPSYVYLQKGLETVYHNLLHYYPRYLHIDQDGAWPFYALMTLIFFSKLRLTAERIHAEGTAEQRLRGLAAGALLWATVVLAFSTMTVVAVNYMSLPDPNRMLSAMLARQEGKIVLLPVLGGLMLSAGIELGRAWEQSYAERKPLRIVIVVLAFALAGVSYRLGVPLLAVFLGFGVVLTLCTLLLLPRYFYHLDIKTVKLRINSIFKIFL